MIRSRKKEKLEMKPNEIFMNMLKERISARMFVTIIIGFVSFLAISTIQNFSPFSYLKETQFSAYGTIIILVLMLCSIFHSWVLEHKQHKTDKEILEKENQTKLKRQEAIKRITPELLKQYHIPEDYNYNRDRDNPGKASFRQKYEKLINDLQNQL
jgi:hypothetical protein